MSTQQNIKFVSEHFPDAHREIKNGYFYIKTIYSVGTLGSGSFPEEAWENAAEYVKELFKENQND